MALGDITSGNVHYATGANTPAPSPVPDEAAVEHVRCGNCEGIDPASCINSPTPAVPDPRFRDQLAEALVSLLDPTDNVTFSLGPVLNLRRYNAQVLTGRVLDALMPVIAAEVEAQVQAAANQRAAEEDVERAARAMHEIPAQPGVYGRIPWEGLMEQHREAYRQMARAAAVALAQPAQSGDVER